MSDMPYPHIEAALEKLLDQYSRLKSPGSYYAYEGQPLAVYYPDMGTFIPTMSLIYLVSLLDDALNEYIERNQLGPAGKLCARIKLLNKQKLVKGAARLHELRKLRNACAHDPAKFIGWADFDKAYEDIKSELRHIGLIA